MSVIITGMDMPKSCVKCDYTSCCKAMDYGANEIDFTIRQKNCPLKSVKGLIEKIKGIEIKCYHETETETGEMSASEMRDRCLEIIKEYCGVEV